MASLPSSVLTAPHSLVLWANSLRILMSSGCKYLEFSCVGRPLLQWSYAEDCNRKNVVLKQKRQEKPCMRISWFTAFICTREACMETTGRGWNQIPKVGPGKIRIYYSYTFQIKSQVLLCMNSGKHQKEAYRTTSIKRNKMQENSMKRESSNDGKSPLFSMNQKSSRSMAQSGLGVLGWMRRHGVVNLP
ncbi:uncharacterized protein LOC135294584 isoform X3 [Passer domesticus]|uniref:uncharacterized protein LOC135294584 isoform X3 n=1 Tax=Passer domesticus TaxID=48849 RepID=UPI0030FE7751